MGVSLRPEYDDYSLERFGFYAELAERQGFDSIWLAESWGLDAVALLSHLGARTRRIGLGTAIVNVFSRTPALLAMSAITLNDLYPGRFVLGLGTSTRALVEDWHGIAFDKPLARLRDAIAIIRQVTAGRVVDHAGDVVRVKGYRLRLKPRSPPPGIWLASLGPESRRLVAEQADGWLPYLLPLRGLRPTVHAMREAVKAAGRPADAVRIAPMVTTAVSEDGDQGRRCARDHLAFYLGAMGPFYRNFVAGFGFEREVDAIHAAWSARRYEAAREAVTADMVDELAIAGTPRECREQLKRYWQEGADLPILTFPGACTDRMVELALNTMILPASEASLGSTQ